VASCVLAIGSRAIRATPEGLLVVQGGGWSEDLEVGRQALSDGATSQQAVEQLAGLGRRDAQYAAVLAGRGPAASWSGSTAMGWAGSIVEGEFAAQGNTLVGAQVLEACRDAWRAGSELQVEERLLQALAAGTAAGGDVRGQQSAVLLTLNASGKPRRDLRVDDDAAAVDRLEHLLTVARAHELLQDAWARVPGDLGAAAELLSSALRLAPQDGLLLQTAALVLLHTGADADAEYCWRRALPGLPDPAARLHTWTSLTWTDPERLRRLEGVGTTSK